MLYAPTIPRVAPKPRIKPEPQPAYFPGEKWCPNQIHRIIE